jgi:hypothetical protein
VLIVLRKFLRLFFHGVTRVGANNLIIQTTGFVEVTLLKHPSNEIRVFSHAWIRISALASIG